jgi:hypothetical protein
MSFIWFLEPWCAIYELDKMWGVEIYLIEEASEYLEELVPRIDTPRLNNLFMSFFEPKTGETGEDKACHRGRTSVFIVRA